MIIKKSTSFLQNSLKFCFWGFLLLLTLNINLTLAQSNHGHIQGKVLDKATNESLPGASIYFLGTAEINTSGRAHV